jgi:hypothetical protein
MARRFPIRVQVPFSDDEIQILLAKCRESGICRLSAYCRMIIYDAVLKRVIDETRSESGNLFEPPQTKKGAKK